MPKVNNNNMKAHLNNKSSQGGRNKPKQPPFPLRQHQCLHPGCGWSYNRRSDLTRHEITHLSEEEQDERKVPCPYEGCEFRTLQAANLKTHLNTHTGAKPWACNVCDYAAADRSCLYKHKRLHHDVSGSSTDAKQTRRKPQPVEDSEVVFPSFDFAASSPYTYDSPGSPSSWSSASSPLSAHSWEWEPKFERAVAQINTDILDCPSPLSFEDIPLHLLRTLEEAIAAQAASSTGAVDPQNLHFVYPAAEADHLADGTPTEPLLFNPALAPLAPESETQWNMDSSSDSDFDSEAESTLPHMHFPREWEETTARLAHAAFSQ
uniref:C2H2-type domain-containing protein n=1 Tax=Mycena chlorophos TaxID=658473 RepID=A0ABQ0L1Z2_MYCCL|nr:predicted protein [Mycena chlorophos]